MQGLKETFSCVHHEGKGGTGCITALLLQVGKRKSEFSASGNFRFIAGDIIHCAPRINDWMAPNAVLNVVSIVTRLGAGHSRHRDSIIGSGNRLCSFPNHQGHSPSLSVYKSYR